MMKLFKSLRIRILIFALLSGIIPIVIIHLLVISTYESRLIEQREIDILQRLSVIAQQLGEQESLTASLTEDKIETLNWYANAYGGRLLAVDDNCRIIHDTYLMDLNRICISDAVFSALSGNNYQNYRSSEDLLEFVLPVYAENSEEPTVTGVLIMSSDTSWLKGSVSSVSTGMLLAEGIILILLVLVAVYVSYLLVRPINAVSMEIDRLNEGNINVELGDLESYKEIDSIMKNAERMVDHYRDLEESQELFVSNVSHELRTPMTSIRVLADSLKGQDNIPEAMYQEILTDISDEVERESTIIDDLLSMVRLGNGSDSMNISSVNINEFILDTLRRIRPIAEEQKIELIYESFRQVTAEIDEPKLSQAVTNLIENAVKYNKPGGFVKVSIDADHAYFYLKVSDNGIGIPHDALDHVFERFYRVDKARSRETGGTGLGLSIARTIILQHYGVIKAESEEGEGTTFTVRIPLKHIMETGGRS